MGCFISWDFCCHLPGRTVTWQCTDLGSRRLKVQLGHSASYLQYADADLKSGPCLEIAAVI